MGKHSRCVIGECGNDMWNPELHKEGFVLQWDGGGGGWGWGFSKHTCSFKKYALVCKKSGCLVKNGIFTQSNSVRHMLGIL